MDVSGPALVAVALLLVAIWAKPSLFDFAEWLDWLSGIKTSYGLAGDPFAYFQKLHKEGVDWVRMTPGQLGGRKTIMLIDPQMLEQVYKGSATTQSSSRAAHYFDFAVFRLSKAWLGNYAGFHKAEPVLYRIFGAGAIEEPGSRFRRRFDRVFEEIEQKIADAGDSRALPLYNGIFYEVNVALNEAFFGSEVDMDKVLPGVKRFERGFSLVGATTILPLPFWLTRRTIARAPSSGIAEAADAFQEWLDRKGHHSAVKPFADALDMLLDDPNFDKRDASRAAAATNFAASSNTLPAIFWTFLLIASSPRLLARVRAQIKELRARDDPSDLTVANLATALPLLRSCFFETLRHFVQSFSVRLVMKDCAFSGRNGKTLYLKQGQCVMSNGTHSHMSEEIWEDAKAWKGDRFLADDGTFDTNKASKVFSFGGGIGICKGRSIAAFELIYSCMSLLERYDCQVTEMVDDDGKIVPPTLRKVSGEEDLVKTPALRPGRYGSGSVPPIGDVLVRFTPREMD